MKKTILFLGMLVMMATGLHATWKAYYTGDSNLATPGTDSLLLNQEMTFSGTGVTHPTSPTPPQGDQWLLHATNPSNDAHGTLVSSSVITGTSGQFVVYFRTSTLAGSDPYNILDAYDYLGLFQFRLRYQPSNASIQSIINGSGSSSFGAGTGASSISANTTYKITYKWSGAGTSITLDAGAPSTNPTVWSYSNLVAFYIGSGLSADNDFFYEDALAFSDNTTDIFPPTQPTATVTPTATPTSTRSNTFTFSPTLTRTNSFTFSPTRSPTLTPSPTPTNSPTLTRSPTITLTPSPTVTLTATQTPTPTYSYTKTFSVTVTQSSTASPTPTAAPGVLTFDYSVAGQVYCTWPGTNINGGNGSTVYVAYGPNPANVYPYSSNGGYDPVHDVFFATVHRSWPFYAKGRIINPQGTFSTTEAFAYGPYTLTPTLTASPTKTDTPDVTQTPSVTKTSTYTATPTPVVTNVTVEISVSGQTHISWESTANVEPSMDVYVQYGTTTAYGFQAGGGYDASYGVFFATVPRDANTSPFHFRCVIHNSRGTSRSADFSAP